MKRVKRQIIDIGNSVNDGYYMTVGDKSKIYTVSSSVLSPIRV